MKPRIDLSHVSPAAYKAVFGLEQYVRGNVDGTILHLVKIRASQINGCAYCIDMHTKDARAAGETEERLYALIAWRETPFFTDRERAALALTEEVTLISEAQVRQPASDEAAKVFEPAELTKLVYAIIEINAWNRLAITVGAPEAGSYTRPE